MGDIGLWGGAVQWDQRFRAVFVQHALKNKRRRDETTPLIIIILNIKGIEKDESPP